MSLVNCQRQKSSKILPKIGGGIWVCTKSILPFGLGAKDSFKIYVITLVLEEIQIQAHIVFILVNKRRGKKQFNVRLARSVN